MGFQIRSAPPFVELVRRIHAGALGEIAAAQAHYNAALPDYPEFPSAGPREARLRNWLRDRVLSGDIIVEQNIHVIDICNWVLQGHPLKAVGRGGRKGRGETGGDCYSHFDVIFEYPGGVHVSFGSSQFGKGHSTSASGSSARKACRCLPIRDRSESKATRRGYGPAAKNSRARLFRRRLVCG